MPQRIPTNGSPFYEQATDLDGVTYVLRMSYSGREDRWSLDLLTVDKVPIFSGMRLTPDVGLLRRYHAYALCPPGEIVCVSYDAANDSPPGLLDLLPGGRCELLYCTAAELAGAL